MSVPGRNCVHTRFEHVVKRQPNSIALRTRTTQLTYQELDARANRIACHLASKGVHAEVAVGIFAGRGVGSVVGMLGVLKAGGFYVPLDVGAPPARLREISADARCRLVLTIDRQAFGAVPSGVEVVEVDEREWGAIEHVGSRATPHNLAYCMYTSGSTGAPKRVGTEHANIVNLVTGASYVEISPRDVVLHAASLSFDASTFEVWGALLNGATLAIVEGCEFSLDALARAVADMNVSVMWLTAPLLHQIARSDIGVLKGVQKLLSGGDVLQPAAVAAVQRTLPDVVVINGYGPTETTTFASCYTFPQGFSGQKAPIGKAIQNVRVHILDCRTKLELCEGQVGEIHICGAGVGRGYIGRPDATAASFVPSPFAGPGERMYATGDLGRRLPDGNIEFLGRVDRQVKIRGFRVEPAEIEAALLKHASIRDVVVVAEDDALGNKRLVAYVVHGSACQPSPASIRAFLGSTLPEYMVPTSYVFVTALPLNANGKIDRQALPQPGSHRALEGEYIAPRTPLERELVELWSEILHVGVVGVNDGFRNLGGSSIQAIEIAWRLTRSRVTVARIPAPVGNITISTYALQIDSALASSGAGALTPVTRPSELVASYAQEQLWFLEGSGEAWRAYRFHARVDFTGSLDAASLQRALNDLTARHESLRTRFVERDGALHLEVVQRLVIALPVIDLEGLDEESKRGAFVRVVEQELAARFDWSIAPLVRWVLIRLEEKHHVLLHSEHHAIHDGQSFRILVRDLGELYSARAQRLAPSLPPVLHQYQDFCADEKSWLASLEFRRQRQEWIQRVREYTDARPLFAERSPAPRRRFVGAQVRRKIEPHIASAVSAAAAGMGVSRFALLLTAFGVLCAKYSGAMKFLIGVALANRSDPRFSETVGMFVNMVPVPFMLDSRPSLTLIRDVADNVDFALQRSGVPLAEIVKALGSSGRPLGEPPFNVAFSCHDSIPLRCAFDNVAVAVIEGLSNGSAKFDLNVVVIAEDGPGQSALELTFEYNSDLFEHPFVERMVTHYLGLLREIAERPEASAATLSLCTQDEAQLAVARSCGRLVKHGRQNVIDLFEAQVRRVPAALAVLCGDRSYEYEEVNLRANRLARFLRQVGVQSDQVVAICLNPSIDMIASVLAVLKAGAAYLPLDGDQPPERLRYMLREANSSAVITEERFRSSLDAAGCNVISLEVEAAAIACHAAHNLGLQINPEHLAYCIYTSGSTGNPKAAANTHESLANLLHWYFDGPFSPQTGERVLVASSVGFDLTQKNLLGPLCVGAAVVICTASLTDAREFLSTVERWQPTRINCAPSAFRALALDLLGQWRPKVVMLGGEQIDVDIARAIAECGIALVNSYGPTECADVVSFYVRSPDDTAHPIPIGCPIPNAQVLILDEQLSLVPDGLIGEICIGGISVGRGYLGSAVTTAEKFVPNPFGDYGSRMYRTGDLGFRAPSGAIVFIGRKDHQVKLRGYRIELSEIEAALLTCDGVRRAVVLLREDRPGDKRLVAYVVGAEDCKPEPAALNSQLRDRLPPYMLPSYYVCLDILPTNASGKVDRGVLPPPHLADSPLRQAFGREQRANSNTAATILELMKSIVGEHSCAADTNLFEAGFHSIDLMRLVVKCRTKFNVPLSVSQVVEAGTAYRLAEVVDAAAIPAPH